MKKMNAKKTLVSFLAIATLLFLAAGVSASSQYTVVEEDGFTVTELRVDGIDITTCSTASLNAGDTVSIKVYFESGVDESDVRVKATLEGNEGEDSDVTSYFDVEDGNTYVKTLTLKVPEVDKDEVSEDMTLTLRIWNSDFETEVEDENINVQRTSYDADVKSIIVSSKLEAGQISPVDVVLKNTGYNDLEDIDVTVRIPELDIERTAYFGDLVSIEGKLECEWTDDGWECDYNDDDDEDTVSGRIYLEIPYDVASGIYTLEVEVGNEDFNNIVTKQVAIENGFPEVALKSGDNLLVLNPTNQLKVYRVVYPAEELTVVVQAGSSKLVPIKMEDEQYNFDVFVFSGNELVGTVNFSGSAGEEKIASPVVVLTVILAIIFLVLLVVMIVLITKKPEKTEEFGESYY